MDGPTSATESGLRGSADRRTEPIGEYAQLWLARQVHLKPRPAGATPRSSGTTSSPPSAWRTASNKAQWCPKRWPEPGPSRSRSHITRTATPRHHTGAGTASGRRMPSGSADGPRPCLFPRQLGRRGLDQAQLGRDRPTDQVGQPVGPDPDPVGGRRQRVEVVSLGDYLRRRPGERDAQGPGDGRGATQVGDEPEVAVPVRPGSPIAEARRDVAGDDDTLPLRVLGGGRVVGVGLAERVAGGGAVPRGPDPVAQLQVVIDGEPAPADRQAQMPDQRWWGDADRPDDGVRGDGVAVG